MSHMKSPQTSRGGRSARFSQPDVSNLSTAGSLIAQLREREAQFAATRAQDSAQEGRRGTFDSDSDSCQSSSDGSSTTTMTTNSSGRPHDGGSDSDEPAPAARPAPRPQQRAATAGTSVSTSAGARQLVQLLDLLLLNPQAACAQDLYAAFVVVADGSAQHFVEESCEAARQASIQHLEQVLPHGSSCAPAAISGALAALAESHAAAAAAQVVCAAACLPGADPGYALTVSPAPSLSQIAHWVCLAVRVQGAVGNVPEAQRLFAAGSTLLLTDIAAAAASEQVVRWTGCASLCSALADSYAQHGLEWHVQAVREAATNLASSGLQEDQPMQGPAVSAFAACLPQLNSALVTAAAHARGASAADAVATQLLHARQPMSEQALLQLVQTHALAGNIAAVAAIMDAVTALADSAFVAAVLAASPAAVSACITTAGTLHAAPTKTAISAAADSPVGSLALALLQRLAHADAVLGSRSSARAAKPSSVAAVANLSVAAAAVSHGITGTPSRLSPSAWPAHAPLVSLLPPGAFDALPASTITLLRAMHSAGGISFGDAQSVLCAKASVALPYNIAGLWPAVVDAASAGVQRLRSGTDSPSACRAAATSCLGGALFPAPSAGLYVAVLSAMADSLPTQQDALMSVWTEAYNNARVRARMVQELGVEGLPVMGLAAAAAAPGQLSKSLVPKCAAVLCGVHVPNAQHYASGGSVVAAAEHCTATVALAAWSAGVLRGWDSVQRGARAGDADAATWLAAEVWRAPTNAPTLAIVHSVSYATYLAWPAARAGQAVRAGCRAWGAPAAGRPAPRLAHLSLSLEEDILVAPAVVAAAQDCDALAAEVTQSLRKGKTAALQPLLHGAAGGSAPALALAVCGIAALRQAAAIELGAAAAGADTARAGLVLQQLAALTSWKLGDAEPLHASWDAAMAAVSSAWASSSASGQQARPTHAVPALPSWALAPCAQAASAAGELGALPAMSLLWRAARCPMPGTVVLQYLSFLAGAKQHDQVARVSAALCSAAPGRSSVELRVPAALAAAVDVLDHLPDTGGALPASMSVQAFRGIAPQAATVADSAPSEEAHDTAITLAYARVAAQPGEMAWMYPGVAATAAAAMLFAKQSKLAYLLAAQGLRFADLSVSAGDWVLCAAVGWRAAARAPAALPQLLELAPLACAQLAITGAEQAFVMGPGLCSGLLLDTPPSSPTALLLALLCVLPALDVALGEVLAGQAASAMQGSLEDAFELQSFCEKLERLTQPLGALVQAATGNDQGHRAMQVACACTGQGGAVESSAAAVDVASLARLVELLAAAGSNAPEQLRALGKLRGADMSNSLVALSAAVQLGQQLHALMWEPADSELHVESVLGLLQASSLADAVAVLDRHALLARNVEAVANMLAQVLAAPRGTLPAQEQEQQMSGADGQVGHDMPESAAQGGQPRAMPRRSTLAAGRRASVGIMQGGGDALASLVARAGADGLPGKALELAMSQLKSSGELSADATIAVVHALHAAGRSDDVVALIQGTVQVGSGARAPGKHNSIAAAGMAAAASVGRADQVHRLWLAWCSGQDTSFASPKQASVAGVRCLRFPVLSMLEASSSLTAAGLGLLGMCVAYMQCQAVAIARCGSNAGFCRAAIEVASGRLPSAHLPGLHVYVQEMQAVVLALYEARYPLPTALLSSLATACSAVGRGTEAKALLAGHVARVAHNAALLRRADDVGVLSLARSNTGEMAPAVRGWGWGLDPLTTAGLDRASVPLDRDSVLAMTMRNTRRSDAEDVRMDAASLHALLACAGRLGAAREIQMLATATGHSAARASSRAGVMAARVGAGMEAGLNAGHARRQAALASWRAHLDDVRHLVFALTAVREDTAAAVKLWEAAGYALTPLQADSVAQAEWEAHLAASSSQAKQLVVSASDAPTAPSAVGRARARRTSVAVSSAGALPNDLQISLVAPAALAGSSALAPAPEEAAAEEQTSQWLECTALVMAHNSQHNALAMLSEQHWQANQARVAELGSLPGIMGIQFQPSMVGQDVISAPQSMAASAGSRAKRPSTVLLQRSSIVQAHTGALTRPDHTRSVASGGGSTFSQAAGMLLSPLAASLHLAALARAGDWDAAARLLMPWWGQAAALPVRSLPVSTMLRVAPPDVTQLPVGVGCGWRPASVASDSDEQPWRRLRFVPLPEAITSLLVAAAQAICNAMRAQPLGSSQPLPGIAQHLLGLIWEVATACTVGTGSKLSDTAAGAVVRAEAATGQPRAAALRVLTLGVWQSAPLVSGRMEDQPAAACLDVSALQGIVNRMPLEHLVRAGSTFLFNELLRGAACWPGVSLHAVQYIAELLTRLAVPADATTVAMGDELTRRLHADVHPLLGTLKVRERSRESGGAAAAARVALPGRPATLTADTVTHDFAEVLEAWQLHCAARMAGLLGTPLLPGDMLPVGPGAQSAAAVGGLLAAEGALGLGLLGTMLPPSSVQELVACSKLKISPAWHEPARAQPVGAVMDAGPGIPGPALMPGEEFVAGSAAGPNAQAVAWQVHAAVIPQRSRSVVAAVSAAEANAAMQAELDKIMANMVAGAEATAAAAAAGRSGMAGIVPAPPAEPAFAFFTFDSDTAHAARQVRPGSADELPSLGEVQAEAEQQAGGNDEDGAPDGAKRKRGYLGHVYAFLDSTGLPASTPGGSSPGAAAHGTTFTGGSPGRDLPDHIDSSKYSASFKRLQSRVDRFLQQRTAGKSAEWPEQEAGSLADAETMRHIMFSRKAEQSHQPGVPDPTQSPEARADARRVAAVSSATRAYSPSSPSASASRASLGQASSGTAKSAQLTALLHQEIALARAECTALSAEYASLAAASVRADAELQRADARTACADAVARLGPGKALLRTIASRAEGVSQGLVPELLALRDEPAWDESTAASPVPAPSALAPSITLPAPGGQLVALLQQSRAWQLRPAVVSSAEELLSMESHSAIGAHYRRMLLRSEQQLLASQAELADQVLHDAQAAKLMRRWQDAARQLSAQSRELRARLRTARNAVEDLPVVGYDLRRTAGLRAWGATAAAEPAEVAVSRAGGSMLSRARLDAADAVLACTVSYGALAAAAATVEQDTHARVEALFEQAAQYSSALYEMQRAAQSLHSEMVESSSTLDALRSAFDDSQAVSSAMLRRMEHTVSALQAEYEAELARAQHDEETAAADALVAAAHAGTEAGRDEAMIALEGVVADSARLLRREEETTVARLDTVKQQVTTALEARMDPMLSTFRAEAAAAAGKRADAEQHLAAILAETSKAREKSYGLRAQLQHAQGLVHSYEHSVPLPASIVAEELRRAGNNDGKQQALDRDDAMLEAWLEAVLGDPVTGPADALVYQQDLLTASAAFTVAPHAVDAVLEELAQELLRLGEPVPPEPRAVLESSHCSDSDEDEQQQPGPQQGSPASGRKPPASPEQHAGSPSMLDVHMRAAARVPAMPEAVMEWLNSPHMAPQRSAAARNASTRSPRAQSAEQRGLVVHQQQHRMPAWEDAAGSPRMQDRAGASWNRDTMASTQRRAFAPVRAGARRPSLAERDGVASPRSLPSPSASLSPALVRAMVAKSAASYGLNSAGAAGASPGSSPRRDDGAAVPDAATPSPGNSTARGKSTSARRGTFFGSYTYVRGLGGGSSTPGVIGAGSPEKEEPGARASPLATQRRPPHQQQAQKPALPVAELSPVAQDAAAKPPSVALPGATINAALRGGAKTSARRGTFFGSSGGAKAEIQRLAAKTQRQQRRPAPAPLHAVQE